MRLDEMISVDNANANANDDGCRLLCRLLCRLFDNSFCHVILLLGAFFSWFSHHLHHITIISTPKMDETKRGPT